MSLRGRGRFRQSDVMRALKAARAAGMGVARFEIDPDTGRIIVVAEYSENSQQGTDLDKWMAHRADKA